VSVSILQLEGGSLGRIEIKQHINYTSVCVMRCFFSIFPQSVRLSIRISLVLFSITCNKNTKAELLFVVLCWNYRDFSSLFFSFKEFFEARYLPQLRLNKLMFCLRKMFATLWSCRTICLLVFGTLSFHWAAALRQCE